MVAAVVTVVNAITSTADGGFVATIANVSAVVSTRAEHLIVVTHTLEPVIDVIWDVCGASPQVMTSAGRFTDSQLVSNFIGVWHLANPTPGEHIVRAYCSGTSAGKTLGAYAIRGAADVPIGSLVAATGSGAVGISANVVSTANETVIDATLWSGAANTSANAVINPIGNGQVLAYNRRPAGNTGAVHTGSYRPGSVSTDMLWMETIGAGSQFLHVAFNLAATAASAATLGSSHLRQLGIRG